MAEQGHSSGCCTFAKVICGRLPPEALGCTSGGVSTAQIKHWHENRQKANQDLHVGPLRVQYEQKTFGNHFSICAMDTSSNVFCGTKRTGLKLARPQSAASVLRVVVGRELQHDTSTSGDDGTRVSIQDKPSNVGKGVFLAHACNGTRLCLRWGSRGPL